MSLPGMAASVSALLRTLEVTPCIAAGHSAGAAVLARLCLDGEIAPRVLVSLNGALLPLPGPQAMLFSPLAKMFSQFSAVPRLFARHASHEPLVWKLLRNTGSELDDSGVALYRRLASNPEHVGAALDMMANWNLWRLVSDLPRLQTPLFLVTGGNDRTISPADTRRVLARVSQSKALLLPGLGHLAHEEEPRLVAALLVRVARHFGTLPDLAKDRSALPVANVDAASGRPEWRRC
jgi:putative magnesium chelatase accessory protein